MHDKTKLILQAIVAGHSCEEILAEDRSLTYRDIFHAAGETPTRQWKKKAPGKRAQPWAIQAEPSARPFRSRVD